MMLPSPGVHSEGFRDDAHHQARVCGGAVAPGDEGGGRHGGDGGGGGG